MISLVDHKRFRFEMLDYEARSKNQDFRKEVLGKRLFASPNRQSRVNPEANNYWLKCSQLK
jgi:hypothetical protein